MKRPPIWELYYFDSTAPGIYMFEWSPSRRTMIRHPRRLYRAYISHPTHPTTAQIIRSTLSTLRSLVYNYTTPARINLPSDRWAVQLYEESTRQTPQSLTHPITHLLHTSHRTLLWGNCIRPDDD